MQLRSLFRENLGRGETVAYSKNGGCLRRQRSPAVGSRCVDGSVTATAERLVVRRVRVVHPTRPEVEGQVVGASAALALATDVGTATSRRRRPSGGRGRVQRPRLRKLGAARPRVPEPHVARLVSAAPTLRDQAGILLLGRLALRKNDLRELQLADIDLARDEVYLRHAKRGKEHVLPLAFPDLREMLYLHLQERGGGPAEYLIYPKSHRTRPMSPAGIDRWFGRCVEAAGLSGYTMHQLRHAAIDQVRRATGDLEIARLLDRHENVSVTQDYLHSTIDDLRAAIEGIVERSV